MSIRYSSLQLEGITMSPLQRLSDPCGNGDREDIRHGEWCGECSTWLSSKPNNHQVKEFSCSLLQIIYLYNFSTIAHGLWEGLVYIGLEILVGYPSIWLWISHYQCRVKTYWRAQSVRSSLWMTRSVEPSAWYTEWTEDIQWGPVHQTHCR